MLTSSSRRTIASRKCVLPPLSESPAEAYTPLAEEGEVDERNIDMRRVISKKNSRNRLLPYQRVAADLGLGFENDDGRGMRCRTTEVEAGFHIEFATSLNGFFQPIA
ncbi:hypothetical protein L2E82_01976 [Cichorium intybus]|uniref:Uncharacterized protein n=1 Tax=Cichorium intybus TaxID=13427 RepID=A0ACB9H111_CICIN|nr:hypothetical protein L2E82_01976 [Cichorium intybus]